MACIINIPNTVLQGESSGGIVTYLFYDSNGDGMADSGGSPVNIASDGSVNFEGYVPGDYYFNYTVGVGECEVTGAPFFIRVLEQSNAGIGQTINRCQTDPTVNLFSLLSGNPMLTGSWSGNGISNAGYSAGSPTDPTDDTFNPALSGNGVFQFIYTVAQIAPNGFQLSDCENCNPVSTVVTINMTTCNPPTDCDTGISTSVQVCSGAGCSFNLFSQLGGTPATGGTWTLLPGAPSVIVISGGYLGTVNFAGAPVGNYQFQYSLSNVDPLCVNTSVVTVQVVAKPNAGTDGIKGLCEQDGNTNLFSSLGGGAQSGGTWTLSPSLPSGTFTSNGFLNPTTGDAGTYVATYTINNPISGPCGTGCSDSSIVTVTIVANCNAGLDGSSTICKTASITLQSNVLMGAGATTGGTWNVVGQSVNCNNVYGSSVFSINGAPAANHQFANIPDGSVINNFASVGCIFFFYTCMIPPPNQFCGDQNQYILHIIDCNPACNAVFTIAATACAMTSSFTGTCPSPVYQWQVQTSPGVWAAAPGTNNLSTYTGLNGSTYRLQITGCVNCGTLYSNSLTLSCPPASCSIATTIVYESALQRFKATFVLTSATAQTIQYNFNQATTGLVGSCTLCGGWAVNVGIGSLLATPGTTYTVYYSHPQSAIEECWRFVAYTTNPSCVNTACMKLAPMPSNSYITLELPTETEITGVTVNVGGGNVVWNRTTNLTQFNCTSYESTDAIGTCNGISNCSLAQLVLDINQKLVAGGYAGTAYLVQIGGGKSSGIRVSSTNVIFVNLLRTTGGGSPISFATVTTTGCDTCIWHFQQTTTSVNFGISLDASNGGTQNLYTLLHLYMPELPNTGTFTKATGVAPISVCSGCLDINTSCLTTVGTTITIVNGGVNHGLLSWSSFVPISNPNPCGMQLVYSFTMPTVAGQATPNNCTECILISVTFIP